MQTELNESTVRSRAKRRGYKVWKARGREHINNRGQYMLVDASRNTVALGGDYDASLDEISTWLAEHD